MSNSKSIAFHTLGCKLNFSETSSLSRQVEAAGFEKKDFDEAADIYVINTCSVTENADKECRQIVRRIQRNTPESIVVVTGCYAQLKPNEIATIEGVDLVLGAAEKFELVKHIKDFIKGDSTKICSCDIDTIEGFNCSYSLTDRTRTFLKVQDGCDYNCTFCTIPLARGHSRSDSLQGVLKNTELLSEKGVKEIVLTGINLGDFGKGNENQENFLTLLSAIETQDNSIERYRISSIEPNLLSDDIISFVTHSKKIMPHFHIPLQSGSNKILGQMRRRYQRELYADKIKKIKEKMPHCCIGVDVIVGFPGEGDLEFEETFDFLHSLDVSYLHVFTYSERADTYALTLKPIVPIVVRNERNKILRNLSIQKQNFFNNQFLGQTRPVLWEGASKGLLMEGYTDNYIRVQRPFELNLINQITDWVIK